MVNASEVEINLAPYAKVLYWRDVLYALRCFNVAGKDSGLAPIVFKRFKEEMLVDYGGGLTMKGAALLSDLARQSSSYA